VTDRLDYLLEEQTIAVVDVETTGLSAAYGDRVCEIGIVLAQGDTILETYQTLVNPQRPISPGASSVNGLTDVDVSGAPAFSEIAAQVLERIDGRLLVCHNAPFDLGFLEAEFSRLGLRPQPDGVIDTLDLARRHFHFRSNSLPAVASYLGIETPHAHRALGDALTTFYVFRRLYNQLSSKVVSAGWGSAGSYQPVIYRTEEIVLPPEIQEALSANKAVVITYVDAKGDETTRMITPLRVQAANELVYLVAYCHLRQAERSFRLDRIIEIGEIE
jgi:DNA polymerase III epsilon subunit family exonuclease